MPEGVIAFLFVCCGREFVILTLQQTGNSLAKNYFWCSVKERETYDY